MKPKYILTALLLASSQMAFAQRHNMAELTAQPGKIILTEVEELPEFESVVSRKDPSVSHTINYSNGLITEERTNKDGEVIPNVLASIPVVTFKTPAMEVLFNTSCNAQEVENIRTMVTYFRDKLRYMPNFLRVDQGEFDENRSIGTPYWTDAKGTIPGNTSTATLQGSVVNAYGIDNGKKVYTLDFHTKNFMGKNAELSFISDAQFMKQTQSFEFETYKDMSELLIVLSPTCSAYSTGSRISVETYISDEYSKTIILDDVSNGIQAILNSGANAFDPYVKELEAQIAANQEEISQLRGKIEELGNIIDARDSSIERLEANVERLKAELAQAEEDYKSLYGTYSDLYDGVASDMSEELNALRLYLDDYSKTLAEAKAYVADLSLEGTLTVGTKAHKEASRDFRDALKTLKRKADDLADYGINLGDDHPTMITKMEDINDVEIRTEIGRKIIPEVRNALDELAKNATLLGYTRDQVAAAFEDKGLDIGEFNFQTLEAENRYKLGLKADNEREDNGVRP